MKVSTIGKASAAFAALGTIAGPYAAVAGATPTHASAAASPTGSAIRASSSFPIPGQCAVNDYRRQEVTNLANSAGATNADRAELYYSPSSRCVYAKFVNASGTCGPTAGGLNRCIGTLQQSTSSGSIATIGNCQVQSGQSACTIAPIYDGGLVAAAVGDKQDGQHWFGKTDFW
jgi:hypothetical protein